jgi:RNA polymerase sigma-70 factor (ECF subfamily)
VTRSIFQDSILPIRHKLYRFALRITGRQQDAEDVVQEVLEKVWKTAPEQSEVIQNWEAWCMMLTRNRSLDKNRAVAQRHFAPLESVLEFKNNAQNPAQYTETADMAAQIKQLMHSLPEKQRLVMHLRDVEELTYDEIAETLQITLDQVKVYLHRARKTIREKVMSYER